MPPRAGFRKQVGRSCPLFFGNHESLKTSTWKGQQIMKDMEDDVFNFSSPVAVDGESAATRRRTSGSPVLTLLTSAGRRTQANAYHYLRRFGE